jgi:hypothetical protein
MPAVLLAPARMLPEGIMPPFSSHEPPCGGGMAGVIGSLLP